MIKGNPEIIKRKKRVRVMDQNLYDSPEKTPNEYGCDFNPENSPNGLR